MNYHDFLGNIVAWLPLKVKELSLLCYLTPNWVKRDGFITLPLKWMQQIKLGFELCFLILLSVMQFSISPPNSIFTLTYFFPSSFTLNPKLNNITMGHVVRPTKQKKMSEASRRGGDGWSLLSSVQYLLYTPYLRVCAKFTLRKKLGRQGIGMTVCLLEWLAIHWVPHTPSATYTECHILVFYR